MLKTAERPAKPHLSGFIIRSFPGCSLYSSYSGLLGVPKTHQPYPGNFVLLLLLPALLFQGYVCASLPHLLQVRFNVTFSVRPPLTVESCYLTPSPPARPPANSATLLLLLPVCSFYRNMYLSNILIPFCFGLYSSLL